MPESNDKPSLKLRKRYVALVLSLVGLAIAAILVPTPGNTPNKMLTLLREGQSEAAAALIDKPAMVKSVVDMGKQAAQGSQPSASAVMAIADLALKLSSPEGLSTVLSNPAGPKLTNTKCASLYTCELTYSVENEAAFYLDMVRQGIDLSLHQSWKIAAMRVPAGYAIEFQ